MFVVVIFCLLLIGGKIECAPLKKSENGLSRGYVPLNSLTLSEHRRFSHEGQTNEEDDEDKGQKSEGQLKWWETLPSHKMDKNKVILAEYDKLKSSMPEWPWIEALKASKGQQNQLMTRKKVRDKVRVVVTTEEAITISPTLEDQEDPDLPEEDEMFELDEPEKELPDVSTTKYPDWFTKLQIEEKTERVNDSDEKKPEFPMLAINGPSIKLPSFPIISDKLQLFSSAEQRDSDSASFFDLSFFPQQSKENSAESSFPLLRTEYNLTDLETTSTQVPLVTQSLSPLENRQALTQLVSLYEKAPNVNNAEKYAEMDKTEMEVDYEEIAEEDKTSDEEPHQIATLTTTTTMSTTTLTTTTSATTKKPLFATFNGIPPSVTLQLAQSKNGIAPVQKQAEAPPAAPAPEIVTTPDNQIPSVDLLMPPMEVAPFEININAPAAPYGKITPAPEKRWPSADLPRIGMDKDEAIKMTLQDLIDCNANLIKTVQNELDRQAELLEKLLKML